MGLSKWRCGGCDRRRSLNIADVIPPFAGMTPEILVGEAA
jgi:hypothetical protein